MTTDALERARAALTESRMHSSALGRVVRAQVVSDLISYVERLTAPPRPQDIPGSARAKRERAAIVIDTGERTIGAKIRTVQTTPPTDDEREALFAILDRFIPAVADEEFDRVMLTDAASQVLAAGYRRQGPVTEAEVLAGLNAELPPAHRAPDLSFYAQANIDRMRAALEAARGVIA